MTRYATIALLALAGCMSGGERVPTPSEMPPPRVDATGDACVASAGAELVGRNRRDVPDGQALALTSARSVRWIAPGTMVTKDYRPDRLNVTIDDDGRILSLSCG